MNVKMIETLRISPHADNPRKDLGDLSELAESIKAQGVTSPLTVVRDAGTGVRGMPSSYTAVIGHRRLAAAKVAGVSHVPCSLLDGLDAAGQVAMMLTENELRKSLTAYEQARGFQTMMDLGETAAGIGKRTGFSDSTVRRRLKLMELDQGLLEEAASRCPRMSDYAELLNIKDAGRRDMALSKIGTKDFDWEVRRALEDEKSDAAKAAVLERLGRFAHRIEREEALRDGLSFAEIISGGGWAFEEPGDAAEAGYFYEDCGHYIRLLKLTASPAAEGGAESRAAQELRRALEEQRRKRLAGAAERAYGLRREFIGSVSLKAVKPHTCDILHYLIDCQLEHGGQASVSILKRLLAVDTPSGRGCLLGRMNEERPELLMLYYAYSCSGDSGSNCYSGPFHYGHVPNERLDSLYALLGKLGYEMSSEECQLRDGTHGLYAADEADEADEEDAA